jgi:thiamine-phosphate pyrophosphorylase
MSGGLIPDSESLPIPTPQSPIPVLHAIVDADTAARAGWPILDLAAAYLRGGARFLQLRAKAMPGDRFLATASAIVQLAHRHDALVVINDRADIARLARADGVHVGQEDLSPRAVRAIVGDAAIVGLSTHTIEQVDRAVLEPVSYVAVGPVFGTATKATGYESIGLEMVRDAAGRARARGLPLVAIGGITLEHAASVLDAGAASVAVISDLLAGGDPEARTRAYVERLSRSDRPRV